MPKSSAEPLERVRVAFVVSGGISKRSSYSGSRVKVLSGGSGVDISVVRIAAERLGNGDWGREDACRQRSRRRGPMDRVRMTSVPIPDRWGLWIVGVLCDKMKRNRK